jgi:hypothetical protein
MSDQTDRNQARRDAELAVHWADEARRAAEYFARYNGWWARRLTDRQARFVKAYLFGGGRGGFSATRAAEAAGYAWPAKQGPRLLTFPAVNEAIEAAFRAVYPEAFDLNPRMQENVGKSWLFRPGAAAECV